MKKYLRIICLLLISVMAISTLTGCREEKKAAVAAYNTEVKRITEEADALKAVIKESRDLIASDEKPYDPETSTNLETVVTKAESEIIEIPECKGNAEEINSIVTKTLKPVSYTDAQKTVTDAKEELEKSIKIMKQVTNPSETFVIKCLEGIDGITGYSAVTEDNDPNGNLNKAGGYTATIYFAHKKVDKSKLFEDNIIDNGTDGGGAIEVYANEEDANKRNDYLAGFDGSVMASGSHKVVGTVLVRTSNYLTASQQKELESAIVTNLTTIAE